MLTGGHVSEAETVRYIVDFPNPSTEDAIFLAWKLRNIENPEQYLIDPD